MAERVYGNPVWPLEDQPVGSSITSEQRKANGKFIAWNFYSIGFKYQACCGVVSAIANESNVDPCAREDGGPGLGFIQNSYSRLPSIFESYGYTMPRDWLNITANCYAQVAQLVHRLTTWNGWARPAQREFNEDTQAWEIVGHPSVDSTYELTQEALKNSTNPAAVAGSIAVMMEHPYGVNKVYGYYGDPVGTPEDLQSAIRGYTRLAYTVQSWFSEQDLINYVPPVIDYGTNGKPIYFYIRPWWQRIGR